MCGLVGFLGPPRAEGERRLAAMTERLAHRGPDSSGLWVDAAAGVGLGHARLSIVDLSPSGHQPMASNSGRYVLVFNGEIYNHLDLRAELEQSGRAPGWRGHSDTEALIAGFDAWGVAATVSRAIGMFAFAVWDRETRQLILGRDRMGEKPLYYGWQGEGSHRTFLFGSELRALQAHPSCGAEIDRNAVVQFMRYGHVSGTPAIYAGLSRLTPGCLAQVSLDHPDVVVTPYWSAVEAAQQPKREDTPLETIDALDALLRDAVSRQMLADVPLGAFLSGGIDSSLIVGLMQAQSERPIQTFTMGFREPRYNEAAFAAHVAAHLGTEHTELYVEDADLRDVVPMLPDIYDEPFADASQIPTFLVSKLAKGSIKVALSGDGGDELFCGYDRYRQGAALMRQLGVVPKPLRGALGAATQAIPARFWDQALAPLRRVPVGKEPNGQWTHRMADYVSSTSIEDLHQKLVSRWRRPEDLVPEGREPQCFLNGLAPPTQDESAAERMMLLDQLTYLPDGILTKVDRAAMHVSLETRAPLLDHRVVEFAGRLPMSMKLRDNKSKWALRQVLYRYVPAALIERPKMGFEVPVGIWLRGPLRDWAEDLLSVSRLHDSGYLDVNLVRQTWAEHLSGRFNFGLQLWNILMFLSWQRKNSHLSGPV
ncbi:asparagine synthase (glutamine-hydrolyzing) [Sulfitobacter dubius]|uniref:asparagine synthase (glutamine-hydrolyzing) n=1 Tax=Sulfitobacter dubius TaxID=218673 RepID=UPI0022AF3E95|nr:asparagine synthase (glutamine-hydrolyzing) [Sulfitobacter dubius]MCZ4368502.1 asparagine synthase (glutamine-hydrolyzing) [Sulfitobacter dubius]